MEESRTAIEIVWVVQIKSIFFFSNKIDCDNNHVRELGNQLVIAKPDPAYDFVNLHIINS